MASYRGVSFFDDAVTSYRDLRKGIGILGLSLPFALVIGHGGLARSISAYYYTDMRNWLVGTLWAIGFFLIFYRYGRPDTLLSSIAGVLAILVALFPATPDVPHPPPHQVVIGAFHLVFAAAFLLMLAWFCLFLFTRSGGGPGAMTRQKRLRNTIYRVCGTTIVAAVIAAALFQFLTSRKFGDTYHPVFWSEAVAIISFGLAWLVKGETVFADPPAAQRELAPWRRAWERMRQAG